MAVVLERAAWGAVVVVVGATVVVVASVVVVAAGAVVVVDAGAAVVEVDEEEAAAVVVVGSLAVTCRARPTMAQSSVPLPPVRSLSAPITTVPAEPEVADHADPLIRSPLVPAATL